jgi:hypothetical protein
MRIERQVIGQQAGLRAEQPLQTPALHAGNARVFPFPEIPVVHQHGIGTAAIAASIKPDWPSPR